MVDLDKYSAILDGLDPLVCRGRVSQIIGLAIESRGPLGCIGEMCRIETGKDPVMAEIVGFREGATVLLPLGETRRISPGCPVTATGDVLKVGVGRGLRGRLLDGLGRPLDGQGAPAAEEWRPVTADTPNPLERQRISQVLSLGVKAIDGLLTCGKGQRLGIFAGSGVGKSTLLGMMARNTAADVNVIALIGERGREVRDFLEKDLGPEGLERSVLVVATSDQPPLVRIRGAFVATTIAEYFREQGLDVLLMMDSLTRFAMAQREMGLAIGEPPATRGYPPSVFSLLPKLLERAGSNSKGTITGLYTVLVEGDDFNEPIADTARGILDGHIVLSRQLAAQGHYPAIDVLSSVSRLMSDLVSPEHLELAGRLRRILATYQEARDLIEIGAYQTGADAGIDEAIRMIAGCRGFLRQKVEEKYSYQETAAMLAGLFAD